MENSLILLLSAVLVLFLEGVNAGEYCTRHRWSGQLDLTFCPYGCCGYYPNEYCCSASVGLIVGCVIASIAVVCIIVAIICCCIKKPGGQPGRMINPNAQTTTSAVTVVYTGSNGHFANGHANYAYDGQPPQQPPPYNTFEQKAPNFGQNHIDPAYTPGNVPPTGNGPYANPALPTATGAAANGPYANAVANAQ